MKVLVASSAATDLSLANGRTSRTGYRLAELAHSLERIAETGRGVEVATHTRPPSWSRGGRAMRRILLHFQSRRKPTVGICHEPAAPLSTGAPGWPFPHAGYALTCSPSWREHLLESPPVLNGWLAWYLDERLAAPGARVRKTAMPAKPFVIEDRELRTEVTGVRGADRGTARRGQYINPDPP